MAFFRQLVVLLWKCWIIRRRNLVMSFFELLIPLLLPLAISYFMRDLEIRSEAQDDPNNTGLKVFDKPVMVLEWNRFKDMYSTSQPSTMLYTPSNAFIDDLMNTLKEISGMTVKKVSNYSEIIKVFKNHSTDDIRAGVMFNAYTESNLDYNLMHRFFDRNVFSRKFERDGYNDYISSNAKQYFSIDLDYYQSFCGFQNLIDDAYLTKLVRDHKKTIKNISSLNAFVYPMENKEIFKQFAGLSRLDFVSFTIVLGYIVLYPLIVKRITDEKANKAKELLRMMGMSEWVFWGSHFINFLIVMLFHSLVFTLLFCYDFGNPILNRINPILFFALLLVYCIQTIMFCMTFTTLFNKPVIGVVVMTIVYISSYTTGLILYHPLFGRKEIKFLSLSMNNQRKISSLLPSLGLTWILALVGMFHRYGKNGIGLKELFKETSYYGNITIGEVLIIQIFSCVLYAILIWYLDSVWPFQYGVPKPFYFPCLPSYYCPQRHKIDSPKDIESANDLNSKSIANFETEPKNSEIKVCLKNVSKVFSGGKGVHKVSFNMFKNQITVLLGHNGAGKTTTMNMITGIYPPTSGTIHVNGYDVVTATQKARSSLGLCPQENIIFNDLTVRQHLKLFAVLKDFPSAGIEEEINRVLAILRLSDKKYTLSTSLSGGMKRKLCLGIAMIGSTDILILDEPTSGMDPEARRAVWDILQEVKKQKTILLTTHYMGEADVLGDRIVIMSEGVIKCCGSPMFLKKRFGAGYHLRISKSDNYNKQSVEEILKKHLTESRLQSEINIEAIYSLESEDPTKQTDRKLFPNLFDELESRKSKLGIDSYGISVTTMEDVFIKVGSDVEIDRNLNKNGNKIESKTSVWKKSEGMELFQQRVCGLLLKRIHFARRYWPMGLFQILIPALIFSAAFYLDYYMRYTDERTKNSLKLDLQEIYGKNTFGFFNAIDSTSKSFGEQNYLSTAQRHGMTATLLDNQLPNEWLLSKAKNLDEYRTKHVIGGALKGLSQPTYDIDIWFNFEFTHSLPLSINLMYESLIGYFIPELKNVNRITTTNDAVPEGMTEWEKVANMFVYCSVTCLFLLPIATPFLGASYVLYPIQEQQSKSKFLQLMTGLSSLTFWFCNLIFDIFNHLLAIIILFVLILYFDFYGIFFYEIDSIISLFLLLLLFGFCSIPIAYCFSFWLKQPSTGFTFLVIIYLLFGFIVNALMYLQHVFQEYSKEGKVKVNFIPMYPLVLNVVRLVPIFSLNFGLSKLYLIGSGKVICREFETKYKNNRTAMCVQMPLCCEPFCKPYCLTDKNGISFKSHGIGMELLFMIFSAILFYALIMLFEGEFHRIISRFSRTTASKIANPNEDSDVLAERERVNQLIANKTLSEEAIAVTNLTKFFGPLRAVNNLSFGVHKSECFGLLGVNGAGKTTTFSMLTGDTVPDEGTAYMDSLELRSERRAFQRRIGYCPQFDALLDRLTGEEMLYLFARLRGIPTKNISNEVQNVIKTTDLLNHSKSVTMTYSGGNKRKLSLGLSIIGNPSLIFLDEPTAGVDPVARRKIWQTLDHLKRTQNSALILTSHSMEESEALCARIAIMVSGEFKCFGSTQHLRSKFGQGFTLIVKLKPELAVDSNYTTRVQQFIGQHFPSAVIRDKHENLLNYHITDTSVKWSSLFRVMESAQQELNFEDYNLSDTTLEQIFLAFAKQK